VRYSVSYTQRSQNKCNITDKEVYLGFRGYSPRRGRTWLVRAVQNPEWVYTVGRKNPSGKFHVARGLRLGF